MISVAPTQFSSHGTKPATEDTSMKEHGGAPTELYLQSGPWAGPLI